MDKVGPTGLRVGRRLNELRRERGFTLAELETRLEKFGRPILLSALSKIETSQRRVDVDDLVALALALDVSPNSLLLPGPTETDAPVPLTPRRTLSGDDAWLWAIRDQPAARPRQHILITYTHADEAWAMWIARQLEQAGHDVTIDPWDLDRTACVVVVISRSYRVTNYDELFKLVRGRPDLVLLPVIVDGSTVREGLLGTRQWISIDRTTERQAAHVLVTAVEQLAIPRRPPFDDARFPHAVPQGTSALPLHRAIVAVDIEGSTVRPNAQKVHLRQILYKVIEAALGRIGVVADSQDLIDRGDGLLVLIPPRDEVPKSVLLNTLIPALRELLIEHNSRESERPLRLRAVVHAGEVHFDQNGAFGASLDITMRLLDALPLKVALRHTPAPLALVVSDEIYQSVVRHGYEGIDTQTFQPMRIRFSGAAYRGWIHVPGGPVSR